MWGGPWEKEAGRGGNWPAKGTMSASAKGNCGEPRGICGERRGIWGIARLKYTLGSPKRAAVGRLSSVARQKATVGREMGAGRAAIPSRSDGDRHRWRAILEIGGENEGAERELDDGRAAEEARNSMILA
jgi:hypothetical protein